MAGESRWLGKQERVMQGSRAGLAGLSWASRAAGLPLANTRIISSSTDRTTYLLIRLMC